MNAVYRHWILNREMAEKERSVSQIAGSYPFHQMFLKRRK